MIIINNKTKDNEVSRIKNEYFKESNLSESKEKSNLNKTQRFK